MTNKDIINYVNFRTDLEQLINRYIENGLPAVFIWPIAVEAVNSLDKAAATEIKNAAAEIEAENSANTNAEDDEGVALTD